MAVSARQLLTHYESHPIVLDLYALKLLGPEYYIWEPETLWAELIRLSGSPSISEVNKNKIQAVRTMHVAESPFVAWEAFEKVIVALNGVIPNFYIMQKPSIGQLLCGVEMMLQLNSGIFSDEVSRYTAAVVLSEGLIYAPAPLTYAHYILEARGRLFGKVREAVDSGTKRTGDDTVNSQLGKLRIAQSHVQTMARRLLDQIKVVQ